MVGGWVKPVRVRNPETDAWDILVLTGGASRTETLSIYIYKVLFRYSDMGYGSALTVALFAIVFALSLVLIRFMRISQEPVSE